jgi:predicted esterase YcpF (UPF0227 family)
MTALVYLHGFASSGNSTKVTRIREAFPDHTVIAPNLSHLAMRNKLVLDILMDELIKEHSGDILVIGTSLGGFWADYMALKYNLKGLIINPSTTPHLTLRKYIGQTIEGFRWSEPDCDEYFDIWYEHLLRFRQKSNSPRTVLLAKDDDVLDYDIAANKYRNVANVVIYDDGGHRFERYDDICKHIRELLNTEVI